MKKILLLYISLAFLCFKVNAQELNFTLLHTSDEHSTLMPIPLTEYVPGKENLTLGGFARLATKVKQIKESKGNEPVLLLSCGDIMGGSPFAWLILRGKSAELDIMNKIGYNAMTIGNHEFDYGTKILASYFKSGGYFDAQSPNMKVIASNLNIPTGHPLLNAGFKSDTIFQLSNGLKIGVFGMLGAGAYELAPAADDVKIFDQFEIGKQRVADLRKKGAQVIVLLSHSGIIEDRQMAKKIPGIDVILGGHDHIKTEEPEKIGNTLIFHSGYYLQYLGQIEFSFNSQNKQLTYRNPANKTHYLQPLDYSIPEDSSIAAIILQHKDTLNQFLKVYTGGRFSDVQSSVIKSTFSLVKHQELTETTIGDFVTDAMRFIGTEVSGDKVDFAFQGNGVIRGDIIPGVMNDRKNLFSLFDLITVSGLGSGPDMQPGYPMISTYLTEKEIYNVLEVTSMLSQYKGDNFYLQMSGLRYTYDPGKSIWLTIPFINQPIPAMMAVKKAELYRGSGIQQANGSYRLLDREGTKLYHVVTDYYLAKFLPMVGEILPDLKITFKNKAGKEVSLDESILKQNGKEFKVWEALSRYAAATGNMPDVYKTPQKRITIEEGIPLKIWSWLAISLLFLSIIVLIYKLLRRKKK